MGKSLADQVMRQISEDHKLYHLLVLMVGPSGNRQDERREIHN